VLGGSGLLAVYLAGVVLGEGRIPYRPGIVRVHDALAWLSQLAMFLMLGLLVFPTQLWSVADEGLLLAFVLAFLARPIAVLVSLVPFRLAWRERFFISWVGLRGAVPIILATYPVLRGVPRANEVFNVVFFVVLMNSLIPGATVAAIARRLKLTESTRRPPPASIEMISLRDYPGEFRWHQVSPPAAVAGAAVRDLPLPQDCVLTVVLRGDQVVPPRGDTVLLPGDDVCVFSTREHSALLNLLFGNVDEGDT
jgi:cell volume regulation protein A